MLVGFGLYILALILTAAALIVLVIRAVDPVARKLEELREDAEPLDAVETDE